MKRSHLAIIISLLSMVLTVLLFVHDYLYDTGGNKDSIEIILIVGSIYFVLMFASLAFLYFLGAELVKFFKHKA